MFNLRRKIIRRQKRRIYKNVRASSFYSRTLGETDYLTKEYEHVISVLTEDKTAVDERFKSALQSNTDNFKRHDMGFSEMADLLWTARKLYDLHEEYLNILSNLDYQEN